MTHKAPQLIGLDGLDLISASSRQGFAGNFLPDPTHNRVVAHANQTLSRAQAHPFSIVTQGVLLFSLVNAPVVGLAKRGAAVAADKALVAMTAASISSNVPAQAAPAR